MNAKTALAHSPGPFFRDSRESPDVGEATPRSPGLEVSEMPEKAPQLVTIGVIARELGITVDRVDRVLRTKPHIRPRAYAGNVRLFDNEAIARVRYEINRIDARRSGRSA